MTYFGLIRHWCWLLPGGLLGFGAPVAVAQTTDWTPIPIRAVGLVLPPVSPLPGGRYRSGSSSPFGTRFYLNNLPVPDRLFVPSLRRWLTDEEVLAALPLNKIRRVKRLSPDEFALTHDYAGYFLGTWYIEAKAPQLVKALRRYQRCPHCH